MKLAFTGHRPDTLPQGMEDLRRMEILIRDAVHRLIARGYDTFYDGCAQGADLICAEAVLEARSAVSSARLVCAVPFRDQARGWSEAWKTRYQRVLRQADEVVMLREDYAPGCFHARNRFLVDHCDALLAIYDGRKEGGTAYTVEYALRQGKPVHMLHPQTLGWFRPFLRDTQRLEHFGRA